MFAEIDFNRVQDENVRQLIKRLLNLIEKVSADLPDAQIESQRLRDENNRLKGNRANPRSRGIRRNQHPKDDLAHLAKSRFPYKRCNVM